jgi:hypothetical protein
VAQATPGGDADNSRPDARPGGGGAGRRLVRVGAIVAASVAVGSQSRTLGGAARRLGRLSPWWLAAAAAAEVISYVAAAELQRGLLAGAGVRWSYDPTGRRRWRRDSASNADRAFPGPRQGQGKAPRVARRVIRVRKRLIPGKRSNECLQLITPSQDDDRVPSASLLKGVPAAWDGVAWWTTSGPLVCDPCMCPALEIWIDKCPSPAAIRLTGILDVTTEGTFLRVMDDLLAGASGIS